MSTPDVSTEEALTCFVIGPIGNRHSAHGTPERETYEEALRVMEEVIVPACTRVGLTPVRADGLARAGEINEQIFRRLRDDDVVIADLTGANANVMYELGLRHTRDKLTVQIGEFGRLPFDVNMIRTTQFSRSAVGLINARDELIKVLEAGIAGEFDPVTATRIWAGTESGRHTADSLALAVEDDDAGHAENQEDDRGFIDIMAEAEEQQDALSPALGRIGDLVEALGELSEASAAEIQRSDAAGRGMRGRLQIATRYARGLDDIAERLDTAVTEYETALGSVSAGSLALIEQMEQSAQALDEGREFGMLTRRLAVTTRSSMGSLAGMVDVINENAKLSRVLREPSARLTAALSRVATTATVVDEWDRRLQTLGVSVPAEEWEPDSDEDGDGEALKAPEPSNHEGGEESDIASG